MKVLIVAAIIIAIALFAAIVAPVFAPLVIKNSTQDIPMFWNGTGWEELTTPYNLNPPHNSSMIIVK